MKPEYQCHNRNCGNIIVYCGEQFKDTLCTRCGWLRVEYHAKCCSVGCNLNATHQVGFGEFGAAPLCDKHYAEHDPEEFARVR